MTCFLDKIIIWRLITSKFSFFICSNRIIHKLRIFFIISIIMRFPCRCFFMIYTIACIYSSHSFSYFILNILYTCRKWSVTRLQHFPYRKLHINQHGSS